MRTVTLAEAKSSLEELLYALHDDVLVVENENGQPLAIVTPVRYKQGLRQGKRPTRTLRQVLDEARERIRQDGGIPAEEFWRQLEAEYAAEGE